MLSSRHVGGKLEHHRSNPGPLESKCAFHLELTFGGKAPFKHHFLSNVSSLTVSKMTLYTCPSLFLHTTTVACLSTFPWPQICVSWCLGPCSLSPRLQLCSLECDAGGIMWLPRSVIRSLTSSSASRIRPSSNTSLDGDQMPCRIWQPKTMVFWESTRLPWRGQVERGRWLFCLVCVSPMRQHIQNKGKKAVLVVLDDPVQL